MCTLFSPPAQRRSALSVSLCVRASKGGATSPSPPSASQADKYFSFLVQKIGATAPIKKHSSQIHTEFDTALFRKTVTFEIILPDLVQYMELMRLVSLASRLSVQLCKGASP